MNWFKKRPPDNHSWYQDASRDPRRKWTRQEIFDTVADVLVDALGVDRDEITEDSRLGKDLGAD